MSDVRALLRAKRQEARINHPYASYSSSGQLKCSICGTAVKHASAWEGHLGSKAHRTNVVRYREEERLERENSKMQIFKEPSEHEATADQEEEGHSSSKRRTPDDVLADEHAGKRRKVNKENLPTDFFSDPSHASVLLSDGSDEEDPAIETSQPQPSPEAPKNAIDLEYELFQRELSKTTDSPDLYNRATVFAEPVAASTNFQGFPAMDPKTKENELVGPTEEEIRQKRDQDERELIMDRLLEEERAQEDADTRVLLLKNKVELLRKKRQEARVKKSVS
jgi:zinc finger protein 830